jgi:hypothetical protein
MSWKPVFALPPPTPISTEQVAQNLITVMLNSQRTTDIDLLTKNTPVSQTQILNEVNNNITNFATAPPNVIINMNYIKSAAFIKNNYTLDENTIKTNKENIAQQTAGLPTTIPAPNLYQKPLFNLDVFTKNGFESLSTESKILLILAVLVVLVGVSAAIFFLVKK